MSMITNPEDALRRAKLSHGALAHAPHSKRGLPPAERVRKLRVLELQILCLSGWVDRRREQNGAAR